MLTSKQSSTPVCIYDNVHHSIVQLHLRGKPQLPFTYHAGHQWLPQCKEGYTLPHASPGHCGDPAHKLEAHHLQPYRWSITQSRKSPAPRNCRLVHQVSRGATKPSLSTITSPESIVRARPWDRPLGTCIEEWRPVRRCPNMPEDGKDCLPSPDNSNTFQPASDKDCNIGPIYDNASGSDSSHTLSNEDNSSQSYFDDLHNSADESANDDRAYVNNDGGFRFGYNEAPIPTKFRGRTHYLNFFAHTSFENRDALAETRAHDYLLTCVGFDKDWYSDNKENEALYRMHHIHSLLAGRKDLKETVEEKWRFMKRERAMARRKAVKARMSCTRGSE